jgi:hypothetical protein
MRAVNAARSVACLDVPRLMQQFEGLGDNCDFGMVQRAVGIEPLGLFRFAGCSAADLALLLRTSFQELGEPDDLWLEEVGPQREFLVKSHSCLSFVAHTQRFAGRDDPQEVRSAYVERTRFLKKKLMRDMSLERRLFIYRSQSDPSDIHNIAANLETYGDCNLLWIDQADATHPGGSVERLSDRVLKGHVSYFGSYGATPHLPVGEWIAICTSAYRFWRNTEPPRAPIRNLISRALANRQCTWGNDPSATTTLLTERAPTGDAMMEHRLSVGGERTSVYRLRLPIAFGGVFTFSVWLRVPEHFQGECVVARIPGYPVVAHWRADPKVLGRWQRLWVTANVPSTARRISCDLMANGSAGDVFHSASWCLERRDRPLGYGFGAAS